LQRVGRIPAVTGPGTAPSAPGDRSLASKCATPQGVLMPGVRRVFLPYRADVVPIVALTKDVVKQGRCGAGPSRCRSWLDGAQSWSASPGAKAAGAAPAVPYRSASRGCDVRLGLIPSRKRAGIFGHTICERRPAVDRLKVYASLYVVIVTICVTTWVACAALFGVVAYPVPRDVEALRHAMRKRAGDLQRPRQRQRPPR
jgi:hypothetical protein